MKIKTARVISTKTTCEFCDWGEVGGEVLRQKKSSGSQSRRTEHPDHLQYCHFPFMPLVVVHF